MKRVATTYAIIAASMGFIGLIQSLLDQPIQGALVIGVGVIIALNGVAASIMAPK